MAWARKYYFNYALFANIKRAITSTVLQDEIARIAHKIRFNRSTARCYYGCLYEMRLYSAVSILLIIHNFQPEPIRIRIRFAMEAGGGWEAYACSSRRCRCSRRRTYTGTRRVCSRRGRSRRSGARRPNTRPHLRSPVTRTVRYCSLVQCNVQHSAEHFTLVQYRIESMCIRLFM